MSVLSSPAAALTHKKRLPIFFAGVILALCLGAFFVALTAWRLTMETQALKNSLEQARLDVARQDLGAAHAALLQARGNVQAMQRDEWVLRLGRRAPWIGSRIASLEAAQQTGAKLLDAVGRIFQVADALNQVTRSLQRSQQALGLPLDRRVAWQQLTVSERVQALAALSAAVPELRQAQTQLSEASRGWQDTRAAAPGLPDLERVIEPWMARLEAWQATLSQSVDLLETFLPMSGYPKHKTYLVILQNADELRPTGGFIGTVGLVSLNAGQIVARDFQDVYAIDRPAENAIHDAPPAALQRELGLQAWFLRDSNWSPDFPRTAERLLDVYARERAAAHVVTPPIDGVIALEPGVFQALLQLTGPLNVAGETFTAQDFFDRLQYQVEVGFREHGLPVPRRKDIIARVGDSLFQRVSALPAERWPDVIALVSRALERKDIILYERDPDMLAAFDRHGWTDRAATSSQDYVWIVDANLDAYKTDGVLDKQVFYSLDTTAPGGPLARLRLHYTHQHPAADWRYTTYRDYVRVFVPTGSRLVSVEGAVRSVAAGSGQPATAVDVGHDLGKTVFGTFWTIAPGATRDLTFTYRLPVALTRTYHLLVQKQPGARVRLTLDVLFGKKLMVAEPAEVPDERGDARYRVTRMIDTDQAFDVHTF